MFNTSKGRNYQREVVREQPKAQRQYAIPKKTLSAPIMVNEVCVFTSQYEYEGVSHLAYNTLDFGFMVRVFSEYEPNENGIIEYDPMKATLNCKGTVPTLYIFKSDRLDSMKKKLNPVVEEDTNDIGEFTEEDFLF